MIFRVADTEKLDAVLAESGLGAVTGEALGVH